ncbi:hypothetical protein PRNP1_014480 [Phytophthora ramorum]
MAKEEFVPGPFRRMKLATGDVKELQVVANAILEANLERYQQFTNAEFGKVDTNSWKYIKTKDQIKGRWTT